MKHAIAPVIISSGVLLLGSFACARSATIVLHNFTGATSDGGYPWDSLTLIGSNMYGMTFQGGNISRGALFNINTDGTGFGLPHSFAGGANDGAHPFGSLTPYGSKLFGMTSAGGNTDNGTIFSLNVDGTDFSVLHRFIGGASNGRNPEGSLILSGSKLYGLARSGGSSNNGVVFSINTDGTGFSLLHSFAGGVSDGASPYGSLTLFGSKLFGMTVGGGTGSSGTLFSLNTDGTGYALLHSFTDFPNDGARPYGSLTLSGSKLYGMTSAGGANFDGTIFSINTDGTDYGLLHGFNAFAGGQDGGRPSGSLTLFGSTLYGMTEQGGTRASGTIFQMNVDGTGFAVLESLGDDPGEGAYPLGDLTLSDDGSTLYGMTRLGGSANQGVVFSRVIPEPGAFALLGLGAFLPSARRRNART